VGAVTAPVLAAPALTAAVLVAPATAVITDCQGCGACLLTCPERAIRPAARAAGPAGLVVLDRLCTGCGECVEVCPVDAVYLTSAPVPLTTP
jgi:Pyruvate/2-oxoacid:ferredoxin oxidoreductase delta subunit